MADITLCPFKIRDFYAQRTSLEEVKKVAIRQSRDNGEVYTITVQGRGQDGTRKDVWRWLGPIGSRTWKREIAK